MIGSRLDFKTYAGKNIRKAELQNLTHQNNDTLTRTSVLATIGDKDFKAYRQKVVRKT